jgi:glycosyltransferase involved in cell wall biosynthesis
MNKKILIIMPVYNAEKTLAMAIDSIISQTYSSFYLIIVDDCSTDKSLAIAKSYLKDKRIRVYRNKKNMGAYYSRNIGIYFGKNLSWEYFTTHDADDVSFPDRYEKLLNKFNGHGVNAVQDMFVKVNLETQKELKSFLTMAHAVFKRSVFDSIGYFEEVRFGGDWEYWQRLTILNKISHQTTVAHKEVVGKSFVHDKNLTVLIPLGSSKRTSYIQSTRQNLRKMIKNKNFYRSIDTDRIITERIK